jgi:hypothetical protein
MVASIHRSTQVKQGNVQGIFYLIKLSVKKKSRGGRSFCVGAKDGAGAGAVIRISGSTELEPGEIFTSPQHGPLLFRLESRNVRDRNITYVQIMSL